jgi:predicted nuclease with TOPRIM domain
METVKQLESKIKTLTTDQADIIKPNQKSQIEINIKDGRQCSETIEGERKQFTETTSQLESEIKMLKLKYETSDEKIQQKSIEMRADIQEQQADLLKALTLKIGIYTLHAFTFMSKRNSEISSSVSNAQTAPRSCQEYADMGITRSGTYLIYPDGARTQEASFNVSCEMETGEH